MVNRALHVEKVIDTVNIPDDKNVGLDPVVEEKDGCRISTFVDIPGVFTSFRVQVEKEGTYELPEFVFFFCIDGEGEINGTPIRKGQTVFVPCNFGPLSIRGNVDLGAMTYKNV